MSSSSEYASYVCEQMSDAGIITSKKMFGEYGLFCNGKCFALICNDVIYITPTKAGLALFTDTPLMDVPYDGAKPRIVLEDVEDRDFVCKLVLATCDELPMPKPKKKKPVDIK